MREISYGDFIYIAKHEYAFLEKVLNKKLNGISLLFLLIFFMYAHYNKVQVVCSYSRSLVTSLCDYDVFLFRS